jgi:hypothetical protein
VNFIEFRKRLIAVSFEDDLVKVVYVQNDGKGLAVRKALAIPDADFDDFLEHTKDKEFVVVANFHTMYQDLISLPPAKDKYLETLAGMEIKKRFTGAENFSFFWSVYATTAHEGKQTHETFVYAMSHEDLDPILERFHRHDKTVLALYPSILPLTSTLPTDAAPDETLFCVLDTGQQKTLFLVKNGKIRFVRATQSQVHGLEGPDIDNINMTANYFRQTLRANPSRIVFVGTRNYPYESVRGLIAPATVVSHPPGVTARPEVLVEHVLPISAALFYTGRPWGNLLPRAYRALGVERKVVSSCVVLFLLFSLLCVGSIAYRIPEVTRLHERIQALRTGIASEGRIVRDYGAGNSELQRFTPLVAYMNRAYSAHDIEKALVGFKFLPMEHIEVDSVVMNAKDGSLVIRLQGSVAARNYADMDQYYRGLVDAIRNSGLMDVLSQGLDPKTMVFVVEARWKT